MRFIYHVWFFMLGLLAALASVSLVRPGNGSWNLVQVPVIVLTLAVFFFKEDGLAALTIGMGLGLDIVSAYPFFSWLVILAATALVGWWLSKTVLTNRSLPSLVLLGAAMHLAFFVFELAVSRAAQIFGGSVWYMVSEIDLWRALIAFGIEMAVLAIIFIIYVRLRGERSRMLTHV
jgi:hypothetical protein